MAKSFEPSYTVSSTQVVCLGAVELTSIALGFKTLDTMVKTAAVRIVEARTVCPGKFFILLAGEVACVEESVAAALAVTGASHCGHCLIPNLHASIFAAINRQTRPKLADALGIVETFSAAACIHSADAAVKAAAVEVVSINLLAGLGGKAYYLVAGPVTDVEAAVKAGTDAIDKRDNADTVIIPRLHTDCYPFIPGAGDGGDSWT